MRLIKTGNKRQLFQILTDTASAQAAMMTLRPGQSSSDDPSNEHPRCEQWLFVVSGAGKAQVGARRISLRQNALLLIEKGESHKITATGGSPLVTLNFYIPPAYTPDGEVRRSATRKRPGSS